MRKACWLLLEDYYCDWLDRNVVLLFFKARICVASALKHSFVCAGCFGCKILDKDLCCLCLPFLFFGLSILHYLPAVPEWNPHTRCFSVWCGLCNHGWSNLLVCNLISKPFDIWTQILGAVMAVAFQTTGSISHYTLSVLSLLKFFLLVHSRSLLPAILFLL